MAEFSGNLWPIHPHRLPDELLSFWMLRVAHANRIKLQTFTNVTFGPTASPWARDIDRSASPEFIARLSERTGSTTGELKSGMLPSYEGIVFERHNAKGNTPWILPLGIYHRTRRDFGMQFCPECLFWDKEPYFRRRWRLSFATICDKHGCLLHDRCPKCEAPVIYFRNDLGHREKGSLSDHTLCWQCGFDLRRAPLWRADWLDAETYIALRSLLTFIDDGLVVAGQHYFAYANLFLVVLHRVCEMLASSGTRRRFDCLQSVVSRETGIDLPSNSEHTSFEKLNVEGRHRTLLSALWLLMAWPDRFIVILQKARIAKSHIVADMAYVPFWFGRDIKSLDGSSYTPNEKEAENVVGYLKEHGLRITRSSVVRVLGGKNYKVAERYSTSNNGDLW